MINNNILQQYKNVYKEVKSEMKCSPQITQIAIVKYDKFQVQNVVHDLN